MRSREIFRQPLASNVFGHANTHDCIVKFPAFCGDLAVIAQLDIRFVFQSSFGDPGVRPFDLRFAQSDSLRAYAEMFRSVNDQRAPSTANIEQTLAGPKP